MIPMKDRFRNDKIFKHQYISTNNTKNSLVKNGDIINVLRVFDEISHVEIIGRVKKPGYYKFYEGMSLNDLIKIIGRF